MPPHCDTIDGPVVQAAKKALELGNVNIILPWVYKDGETEVREAFKQAQSVRNLKKETATKLADLWFFETVVRIHREGENAPYTGLKPAGLDFGPVLPKVDKIIEIGDPSELIRFLQDSIENSIREKFEHIQHTKNYDLNDVDSARKYVNTYLGFALYSHHLFENINSEVHAAEVEEEAAEKDRKKANTGHQH